MVDPARADAPADDADAKGLLSAEAASHLEDLAAFVQASPSSYHAAAEGARRLAEAGFVEQREDQPFDAGPGGHWLVRDGALIAWRVPDQGAGPGSSFQILGSHTDSPSLKLKPRPAMSSAGWQQIAVEIYGGPLLNSWLDRELGVAGRIVTVDGQQHLVRSGPIMRVPQLAIHLDRQVNERGVLLDRQQHTAPVWGVQTTRDDVLAHLAELAGVAPDEVVGHDLFAFDTAAPARFGVDGEFFASGRLDNLSSVHATVQAMIDSAPSSSITVLAAFDHEEVGSGSRSGAGGPLLGDVLARIAGALRVSEEQRHQMLSRSFCLSADAGHAVHPNYVGHHDPTHHPLLNGGPLLKVNATQRYATDAVGAARWRAACRAVGVDTQEFVSNNQIPCGSTIGPITATGLGITTVDVGIPLLSMHSAREMAGASDPHDLARAAGAFLLG